MDNQSTDQQPNTPTTEPVVNDPVAPIIPEPVSPIPQEPQTPIMPDPIAPIIPDPIPPVGENPQTGQKNVNWDEVFNYYATTREDATFPSLREVAEHFDLNESTVMRKSSEEGWVAKRGGKIAETEQLRQEKKKADILNCENSQLNAWQKVTKYLNGWLDDFIADDKAWKAGDLDKLKTKRAPSIYALNEAVAILKTATDGERLVLGLPTSFTKTDVGFDKPVKLPADLIKEIDGLFAKNEQPSIPKDPTDN